MVRGFTKVLGYNIPLTGGFAGDGSRFQKTVVGANEMPKSACVGAVGFYGNRLKIGHGNMGGWDVFGPEKIITKSIGNVLYELDNEPALDYYKRHLGDQAKNLPSSALLFPLAVHPKNNSKNAVVRTILSIDEQAKTMTFAGDVPQGYIAQLMKGTFENLVKGASDAAKMSLLKEVRGDQAAIIVSCIGRKLLLGQLITEEVKEVFHITSNTKQLGFYSYGEISPHSETGICELHNQTMTITMLGET